VCQLQPRTDRVGPAEILIAGAAAERQDEPPDGVCAAAAIVDKLLERFVFADYLVLLESRDQIEKRLCREIELDAGGRQGHEYGMFGAPLVAAADLFAPPREQVLGLRRIAELVPQVIGPSAEGVDVVEMLVEGAGQKPRHDRKILVVRARELSTVFF